MSSLVILRQTVTELCASMPAEPVLRTFVQYLIAICSRPETASDVISGKAVQYASMDACFKLGDARSNRSRDIRLLHFVTDERRRRTTPAWLMVDHIGLTPKRHITGVSPKSDHHDESSYNEFSM